MCVTITVSCTIQGVYISCGVAGSKPGARDRASENGMRIFDSRQVFVVPMQRRWRNRNHVQLVLNTNDRQRSDIPPFFSPPEGTKEFRVEKDIQRTINNRNTGPKIGKY